MTDCESSPMRDRTRTRVYSPAGQERLAAGLCVIACASLVLSAKFWLIRENSTAVPLATNGTVKRFVFTNLTLTINSAGLSFLLHTTNIGFFLRESSIYCCSNRLDSGILSYKCSLMLCCIRSSSSYSLFHYAGWSRNLATLVYASSRPYYSQFRSAEKIR
jgi:hypothetical protein